MDFTREPIVETIITPKEGCQLVIRNSKTGTTEHVVEAVEVVAFGTTYFLRSLEKPTAFLLPFGKYEIVEKKITKVVLKKPQIQKSIKIDTKDKEKKVPQEDVESDLEMESTKKEENHKGASKSKAVKRKKTSQKKTQVKENKEFPVEEEKEKSDSRTLLPPPTTLISEQILRYKDYLQTEELAPKMEGEGEFEDLSQETEKILLTPSEAKSESELDKMDVPLSVMKETDDFITQAQDDMFNQSLEETIPSQDKSCSIMETTHKVPPLVIDQEE